MKYILSMILIFTACNACATDIFPVGCKAIIIKEGPLILSAPKPVLIMVHNLSNHDLWVTHPVSDAGASAGWSSQLESDRWSALALHDQSFELTCIESKPGHEQQVACAGLLAVCEWTNRAIPQEVSHTYWAGENMKLSALKEHITQQGFVLRTPAQ